MSATPKLQLTIPVDFHLFFDEDGYLLTQAFTGLDEGQWYHTSIYALVKEVIDEWSDEDGKVRNALGLDNLFNINKELKEAIDLIHEVIDDEGMEDGS